MDFTGRPLRTMVYVAAEGIVAHRPLKTMGRSTRSNTSARSHQRPDASARSNEVRPQPTTVIWGAASDRSIGRAPRAVRPPGPPAAISLELPLPELDRQTARE